MTLAFEIAFGIILAYIMGMCAIGCLYVLGWIIGKITGNDRPYWERTARTQI